MEDLIAKAKKLGFESKFLYNKPYKYSSVEHLRLLFWLTELRQYTYLNWLTYIRVNLRCDGTFEYNIQFPDKNPEDYTYDSISSYITEPGALKAGIEYFVENMIE
jgi:hypothetical protein